MLNFTFAGYGNRIIAQIIDVIIVGFAVSIIAMPIFGFSIFSGMNVDDPSDISALFAGLAILPLLLFAFVGPVVYEVLMISSAKQATFGKMLMKIKVVDEAGLRLTLGAAIGRTLIKYVSSQLCILLWLWPLFNDKEQALHDLAVKDFVIRS
ncbi:RDD family protein [Dyadobacter sp. NIV53]|uniref:RDD family protein n=1 Tax=Dyadobacter sp. NIV53 TaxID=2861765 RepID=UPI001C86A4CD|nr:RDD family protein [Dyadobacter sp. NIV53]